MQRITERVETIATAVANESVDVVPKVSDTISQVRFEDGDFVQQGDILVELTNESEAARLDEALAGAEEARRQFNRIEELYGRSLVARTDLDVAKAAMEMADARLEGVMVAMEDRIVRAPITGVLGFRNVSEGTLATANTVITTLDDISFIKLDFTVPEKHLAQLGTGQKILASTIAYPDRVFEGEVRVVSSRIDPVTRSVSLRAHINNTEGLLRPGMLMTVEMELNEQLSMVVPELSAIVSQGNAYVYVVDDNNQVQQVKVELGRRRPGVVEILSGLTPGDRVISRGVNKVRPGQKVSIMTSDSVTSMASNAAQPDMARSGS
jgi:membrane fusion protein (multidrug efflux system)